MAENSTSRGMGFLSWLMLLFIGLKLTGHIDWSWWWVLSPVWLPLALALPICVLVALVWGALEGRFGRSRTTRPRSAFRWSHTRSEKHE
jgi:hypothetical protein